MTRGGSGVHRRITALVHSPVFAGLGLHSPVFAGLGLHTAPCLQVWDCTVPCTSAQPSVCRSGTAQCPAPVYSPVFAGLGLHNALHQCTAPCLQVLDCILLSGICLATWRHHKFQNYSIKTLFGSRTEMRTSAFFVRESSRTRIADSSQDCHTVLATEIRPPWRRTAKGDGFQLLALYFGASMEL